jgi:rubredoxin
MKKRQNKQPALLTCRMCEHHYESERSKCPRCGVPNILFESKSFIKFEIEMERGLYRSIQERCIQQERTIEEWLVEAAEEFIMKGGRNGR